MADTRQNEEVKPMDTRWADRVRVQLLEDAARAVVKEQFHVHEKRCYAAYEPCGEHHRHTGPDDPHPCGDRRLICCERLSSGTVNRLRDALEQDDG